MVLMSVLNQVIWLFKDAISCISLWKAYFNCVVIKPCGFNETHNKKKITGMLSKRLKLVSSVQIKSLSTSAGTGQPTPWQCINCCCSVSALAVQEPSQRPSQFHVPCSVSNPSNSMDQEAASLWWNFSLLGKENCFWCRDRYSFFTYLRVNQRNHSILFPSFSILHWVHPYFAS